MGEESYFNEVKAFVFKEKNKRTWGVHEIDLNHVVNEVEKTTAVCNGECDKVNSLSFSSSSSSSSNLAFTTMSINLVVYFPQGHLEQVASVSPLKMSTFDLPPQIFCKVVNVQLLIPNRDSVSWSAIITGYNQMGSFESAIKVLDKMIKERVTPTQYTVTSVFASCAAIGALDIGRKHGRVDFAREQFERMSEREIVTWNSMIAGYDQHGYDLDALCTFGNMLKDSLLHPAKFTYINALSACANLEMLKLGKQIHARIVSTDFDTYGPVGNALISMYAKSSGVQFARKIVDQSGVSRLDVIAFTSLLDGYVKLGDLKPARHIFDSLRYRDVVELFRLMVREGPKPNNFTLAAMLSVSSSLTSLNQGKQIHASAIRTRQASSVSVNNALMTIHYALMVDLGRAGLVQEAYDFIEKISIVPDVITWGSLLSSSLANLYSVCGKWEDAAKIRKLMKDGGVKKEQGISWVQIKNKVHVFGAEDGLHPQKDEIYKMMTKIWEDIKKMGFVPDTESVLHDLEEEVKEKMLRHHSEKLAIAFALISTPENTTLRIMKDLRVCNDCHSSN
ncbi:Gamma-glutamyl transpeptidase 1 isoform 1 [Hibiscus syriacus]|uniref:Gamma-glutamyl transpeptidase 1 isoform 1 n=1 Tax=Hibiscus syriacus TaxID=106335 RepID=A0A6A2YD87_HIBSY|nr:Gamma-glutamyl transpeptidase 1 isoform 1 [Hibiscus syriacus]